MPLLDDVGAEDIARIASYAGRPTPKAMEERRETDRKHIERVYDAVNALTFRRRFGAPRLTHPAHPRYREEGFEDDAIEIARRGRAITQKSADASPGAEYNQWRSYVRLGRRLIGVGANMEPAHREYNEEILVYHYWR